MSKKSDCYYTPKRYVDAARLVMGGIELDPTSSDLANKTVQADRIYTLDNSIFRNPLNCETMFFNPPYSDPAPFIDRVVFEFEQGNIGKIIGILNVDCSTRWWREIEKIASAYCFLHDRVQFDMANDLQTEITGADSNNRCQFVFYAGFNTNKFKDVFSGLGKVLL